MAPRILLLAVLSAAIAAPAFAQILDVPASNPSVQSAQGMAAARDRAAMAGSFTRQTQSTTQNLTLDRQADTQAGQRAAARADLARRTAEADQAEAAEAQRRDAEERQRLQQIDPAAAPR